MKYPKEQLTWFGQCNLCFVTVFQSHHVTCQLEIENYGKTRVLLAMHMYGHYL